MSDLLTIQFSRAKVRYTDDFSIIIDGPLWLREMRAVVEMIDTYKTEHKESARREERTHVSNTAS